jgi:hypothetical protein
MTKSHDDFPPAAPDRNQQSIIGKRSEKYYIDKVIQKYKLLREEITESWEQK